MGQMDPRVLPAYAGMIPRATRLADKFQRAPRVCGDDPPRSCSTVAVNLCSPRMRG